jgi:hypothetical protein
MYEQYALVSKTLVQGVPVEMSPHVVADLTDDAWETYGDIEMRMVEHASDSTVSELALPTFERMSRSLLKLSMILAASRQDPTDEKIEVTNDDVVNAAYYIQNWGRFSVDLILNTGKKQSEKLLDKVMAVIRAKPGILKSQLMQHHHFSKREVDEIIATLEERQQIIVEKVGRGSRYTAS